MRSATGTGAEISPRDSRAAPKDSADGRSAGMLVRLDGRVENRLGARLYKFGGNTLFRIHGTNERNMIGPAASPGCIGTLNSDVRAVMP